jgi:hypothetical protein
MRSHVLMALTFVSVTSWVSAEKSVREKDNEPRSGKDTLSKGMDETPAPTVVRRDRAAATHPSRQRLVSAVRNPPIKVVTATAHRRSAKNLVPLLLFLRTRTTPVASQLGSGRLLDSVSKATDRLISRSINLCPGTERKPFALAVTRLRYSLRMVRVVRMVPVLPVTVRVPLVRMAVPPAVIFAPAVFSFRVQVVPSGFSLRTMFAVTANGVV